MLADAIKNLSKHSLIYACSSYLTKIIGFLMIPFYTHYLPPAPYGKVELFDFTIVVIGHLIGINICQAMVKFYLATDDRKEKNKIISTTLIFSTLACLAVIGLLSIFAKDFSTLFYKSTDQTGLVIIVFLNLFMTVVTHQCFNYLQANRSSGWYLWITVGKLILEVGLKVLFIAGLKMGVMGVFLGSLLGGGTIALVLLLSILVKNHLRFSIPTLKMLLLFTFPLILSGVGQACLHFVDRYLVFFLTSDDITGIYGVAYKFGYLANALVVSPFLLIWFPYILSVREEVNIRLICSRIMTYFTLLVGFCSLGMAVYAKEIIFFMTESKYHEYDMHHAVPFILLGYFFWAMFQIVQSIFFIKSKTKYLAWIIGLSGVVNFVLNFIFIRIFSFVGAAVVTAITFAFLLTISYYYAQKLLSISYEWKRIVRIFLTGVLIYGASTLVPDLGLVIVLLLKGILVCLFPVALMINGFLLPEERERLVMIFRVVRGGPSEWRKLFSIKTWFK